MQIYANLFKINEKCHLSSIQKSQQICTSGGDVYYASRNLLSTCYEEDGMLIWSIYLTFWQPFINPKSIKLECYDIVHTVHDCSFM